MAVAMRRCIDLVIAMYAVVRAGGAYVPVDPDHPAERIEYVLESADPVLVLRPPRWLTWGTGLSSRLGHRLSA